MTKVLHYAFKVEVIPIKQAAWDWAIQKLHESHHCWMSLPARVWLTSYMNSPWCAATFIRWRFFWSTHKSGVGDKHSVNIIHSLIWVSDREILCTHEKVLVWIWITEYFVFTGDGFSLKGELLFSSVEVVEVIVPNPKCGPWLCYWSKMHPILAQ